MSRQIGEVQKGTTVVAMALLLVVVSSSSRLGPRHRLRIERCFDAHAHCMVSLLQIVNLGGAFENSQTCMSTAGNGHNQKHFGELAPQHPQSSCGSQHHSIANPGCTLDGVTQNFPAQYNPSVFVSEDVELNVFATTLCVKRPATHGLRM